MGAPEEAHPVDDLPGDLERLFAQPSPVLGPGGVAKHPVGLEHVAGVRLRIRAEVSR